MHMMFYLIAILFPIGALSLSIDQSPSLLPRSSTTVLTRTHTARSLATESNYDRAESFPTEALFQNAKDIDGNIANGERVGGYSESTWSNRCVNYDVHVGLSLL